MTSRFLHSATPIVAAPMAGGATTVALTAAASAAGAFGFLPAGYRSAPQLAADISELRTHTGEFGVNLFVPDRAAVDVAAFARYAASIAPEAAVYGVPLDPLPRTDDDAWGEKIALLREDPVPVVSLTFGLPAAGEIRLLQRAGSAVLATVTTPAEAREAADAGVDGLVVQGPRAGGHSASWDPARRIVERSTSDALAMVRATTKLPLIAAGGVDGADAVRELRHGGATAVAVGTLLLRTAEAGTSQPHRDALASGAFTETALTRVFTGRPARALRNGFVSRHEHEEITAYPAVHHLTRGLRKRAAAAGDTDRLHLWAGTGFREAREEPVAATIARLLSRI